MLRRFRSSLQDVLWPETASSSCIMTRGRDQHKDALIHPQWQLLCPQQQGNILKLAVMCAACRPAGTFHTETRKAHAVQLGASLLSLT
ncbi:uncharacterized [Tachysurus ichikawai]